MKEIPPTAGLPLRWRDFLPAGTTLEEGLAAFLGVPAVQIECSGTAGLVVALSALRQNSRRGSVVIPAYTCPLVAIAVVHCGLKPVLCDLRPDHFELCPQSLAAVCDDDTLAVVPAHLGGRVADLAPVLEIAGKVGAFVIEDAAQALGARWNGQSVGLAGDIGFFSLAVGKGLSIYEGGVLVARDAGMREQLRRTATALVPGSLYWSLRRFVELAGYAALYNPSGLRYAYGRPLRKAIARGRLVEAVGDDFGFDIPLHRVGPCRKSVGANALARLPAFLRQTDLLARRRLGQLSLPVIGDAPGGEGCWPFFMVLLPTAEARDAALDALWGSGLGVSRLFIHALCDYAYLRHLFAGAEAPRARDFAARMLTVSNSPWLGDAEFERICRVLSEFA